MTMQRITGLVAALAVAISIGSPAIAQRAETVSPAMVFERDKCLLTPYSALAAERARTGEFLGPLLVTLFAGLAGDLVKSGVNALGDALDTASQEHGFVAEGAAGIRFGAIDPASAEAQRAIFRPTERCIGLYVPSGEGDIANIFSDTALTRNGTIPFDWLNSPQEKLARTNEFIKLGMTSLPTVYAEGVILPGKEGFIFRPMLVWYRTALKGAPKSRTAAEMHVLFATPSFDAKTPGIGGGFAGARLTLPRLAPGNVLDWNQLQGSKSVWLPLRPTAGVVDAQLQSLNTAYTMVGTRSAELAKADKALAAAQRVKARKPGPEADEAVAVAQETVDEATQALKKASDAVADRKSVPAGATNIQVRFVAIRDANKFGLAVAKALKGQADAAGKGVTDALTPKPDWATTDTTYLTAMITVEQKQKLYDDAVGAGDAAAIVKTGDDLRIAKAKANEAAVAAMKPLPYPGLLNDF